MTYGLHKLSDSRPITEKGMSMENLLTSLWVPVMSLLGVIIGSWITSRTSIKRIRSEDLRIRYNAKLSAYSLFLSKYQEFLLAAAKRRAVGDNELSESEMDSGIAFSSAYASAILQAPPPIRTKLQALYVSACNRAASSETTAEDARLYGIVVELLYEDLQKTLP